MLINKYNLQSSYSREDLLNKINNRESSMWGMLNITEYTKVDILTFIRNEAFEISKSAQNFKYFYIVRGRFEKECIERKIRFTDKLFYHFLMYCIDEDIDNVAYYIDSFYPRYDVSLTPFQNAKVGIKKTFEALLENLISDYDYTLDHVDDYFKKQSKEGRLFKLYVR